MIFGHLLTGSNFNDEEDKVNIKCKGIILKSLVLGDRR